MQHDAKAAKGALVMITLSPDCSIVASIKAAMNTVHQKMPLVTVTALVVAHDEGLCGRARVEVLIMGL
ncbi:MAG: hypothetical protein L0H54_12035 [Alcaligenaceae bacterium]|nr:hypothetical protein [Alcaligenaceae bacterium]